VAITLEPDFVSGPSRRTLLLGVAAGSFICFQPRQVWSKEAKGEGGTTSSSSKSKNTVSNIRENRELGETRIGPADRNSRPYSSKDREGRNSRATGGVCGDENALLRLDGLIEGKSLLRNSDTRPQKSELEKFIMQINIVGIGVETQELSSKIDKAKPLLKEAEGLAKFGGKAFGAVGTALSIREVLNNSNTKVNPGEKALIEVFKMQALGLAFTGGPATGLIGAGALYLDAIEVISIENGYTSARDAVSSEAEGMYKSAMKFGSIAIDNFEGKIKNYYLQHGGGF
jgi:hypothetical protein